ncbi:MAG: hypothetical protein ACLRT5_20195 [Lachnospiraceae bacterium]
MAAKRKKKKAKKIVLGILIGYVLIMAIGYLGISFYFSNHFLKGTTINGIDCENMTADEVKEEIQNGIGQYRLQLVLIDGATETITAEQLNLQYVDDNKVDELLEQQNQWRWIASYFAGGKTYELAANTTYEQDRIDELLDAMSCFQEANIVVAPRTRSWSLTEQNGQYVITAGGGGKYAGPGKGEGGGDRGSGRRKDRDQSG